MYGNYATRSLEWNLVVAFYKVSRFELDSEHTSLIFKLTSITDEQKVTRSTLTPSPLASPHTKGLRHLKSKLPASHTNRTRTCAAFRKDQQLAGQPGMQLQAVQTHADSSQADDK